MKKQQRSYEMNSHVRRQEKNMKYNGFEIIKTEDNRFKILDSFGEDPTKYTYKSRNEAKGVIDNVILSKMRNNRYMPVHHSKYWWAVEDKTTASFCKKEDGKVLLFKNRHDCFAWCEKHNK